MQQRVGFSPQGKRRRGTLVVAVLSLVAGIGCTRPHRGHGPGEKGGVATSLGAPRFVDPALEDRTTSEPLTLDFGRVRIHSEERREVLIRNVGRATFNVTGLRTAEALGGAFGFSSATPFAVSPNQQVVFAVTFHPTAAGLVGGDAVLVIENGAPDALTLRLSGTGYHGESPEFELAPGQLDFGPVQVPHSEERRITLANVGVDVLGTTADNLRFAVVGEDGALFEKTPELTGPDAADFGIVEWPPTGYRSEGLSEGETVDLHLHFTPTSGGSKCATLIIHSNDPRAPSTSVPLMGEALPNTDCILDVVPPALNFGDVEANKHVDQEVALINRGTDSSGECRIVYLDLSRATRDRGAFALPNGPLGRVSIPAGGKVVIPIRFAPRQDGQYSGELVFETSNASPDPSRSVGLIGIASPGCLMIAPRELDFGVIGFECPSRQRIFTVYNTCSSPVSIASIDVQPGPTSPAFQITKMPALPVTLAGGGQSDFGVTYSPLSASGNTETATVAIATSERPDPFLVPLAGRGAPDPPQTDVFETSPLPKFDVLFVIDDSLSMADKQAGLAANLDAFIQFATGTLIDVNVAVTTTDLTSTGAAGRLLPLAGPNPRVITGTTPLATKLFNGMAAVGTSGSESESLLRPVYLALSDPLLTGHNAGFYRDDARLVVVVVSDAADQDPLSTSITDYESFLLNLKGPRRRNEFSVSAVIPTLPQAPTGCSYDAPNAGLDPRVMQVVQDTGGVLRDICDANWANAVQGKVSRVFGSSATDFYLSNTPNLRVAPDPIVVRVDGQRMDQYDASGSERWHYEAAMNQLRFDSSLGRDLAGKTIEVSYHVACL